MDRQTITVHVPYLAASATIARFLDYCGGTWLEAKVVCDECEITASADEREALVLALPDGYADKIK